MMQAEFAMTRFAQSSIVRALLRWVPIAALAPATIGLIIAIGFPQRSEIGFALVAGGMALSIWLPLIGPRIGAARPVDEFDRMIQTRAWLAGCAIASFAAIMGLLMLLGLGMAGNWDRLTLLLAMRTLLTYLIVVLSAVPSFVMAGTLSADDD